MRRREFIAGLGGAAAWPVVARAQQAERVRRIGVLSVNAESDPVFQCSASRSGSLAWKGYRWAARNVFFVSLRRIYR
jgi:hypothetical protein